MPPLSGLRVVLSKIHGYGGVTTRPFKAGEIVCYGDGVLYTPDQEFDDTYWAVLRDHERVVRDKLMAGQRHVFEAEMKERRRTSGHPGHQATP